MLTNNKNSTRVELSSILEELLKSNIRFILVDGLAAVIHGAPATTLDVDIEPTIVALQQDQRHNKY